MATSVPETEQDPGHYGDDAEIDEKPTLRVPRDDGKIELLDTDAWEVLGYSFPRWRKWQILCVVFLIQISMNLNASMYANAVEGISKKHGVSMQKARVPQMTFLIAYAFGKFQYRLLLHEAEGSIAKSGTGCEFWAPWSEEYGQPKHPYS